MARLTVQHCVVNTTTRQYGSHPTSDLLGVDYFFTVPADTEFPKPLGKLELFVRFFGTDLPPSRVLVTMTHTTAPDGRVVFRKRYPVTTVRQPGLVVLDRAYKLLNITLPAAGVYVIRVLRRVRRPWELKPEWRVLATEYIAVVRAP